MGRRPRAAAHFFSPAVLHKKNASLLIRHRSFSSAVTCVTRRWAESKGIARGGVRSNSACNLRAESGLLFRALERDWGMG